MYHFYMNMYISNILLDSHSICLINRRITSVIYLVLDQVAQPDVVTKLLTTDGGVIKIANVILRIDAGCLVEDTEITLRTDDQNVDLKSLYHLGLIQRASSVFEFLPSGLKFLKPAKLMFKYEKIDSNNELFILHGSSHDDRETVWELVSSDMMREHTKKGVVTVKVEGFSFYFFVLAMRGALASLLSHLNNSFTCFAYALYRRQPARDELINIVIVLMSEFVVENKEQDVKRLNDLIKKDTLKVTKDRENVFEQIALFKYV